MSDRLWFTLAAAIAVLMIGFAIVWPQGYGARSPGPFGHPPAVQAHTAPGAAKTPSLGLDSLAGTSSEPAELRPTQ